MSVGEQSTVEEVVETIKTVLKERPPVTRNCLAVIDYLSKGNTDKRLTFPLLSGITGCATQYILMDSLLFLTGSLVDVLEVGFRLEYDGTDYDVTRTEINQAKEDGYFRHPITRERIEDFESHIFPYYVASSSFKQLLL